MLTANRKRARANRAAERLADTQKYSSFWFVFNIAEFENNAQPICCCHSAGCIKLVDFGLAKDWQTRILSVMSQQIAGQGEYVCPPFNNTLFEACWVSCGIVKTEISLTCCFLLPVRLSYVHASIPMA
jgi:hypothetical protein